MKKISCFLATVLFGASVFAAPYVTSKYLNATFDAGKAQTGWNATNCHDPKIFQDDDGTYYVYSTDASVGNTGNAGIQVRWSKDLVDWTVSKNSAIKGNWDADFVAWQGMRAAASEVKQNNPSYSAVSWAPTVIKQNGLYYMYHGVSTDVHFDSGYTFAASSITLAIASSPFGPFYPASYVSSYSGPDSDVKAIKATLESLGVSYSQNFLVRYCPKPIGGPSAGISRKELGNNGASLGTKKLPAPDYGTCNNFRYGCIDPEFVYDLATGALVTRDIGGTECYPMIYGSWMNAIVLTYVEKTSLKPVALLDFDYKGKSYKIGDVLDISLDEAACAELPGDANFGLLGTPLIGGSFSDSSPNNAFASAYEGAQLFYNSDTGYYYIITSCGGLVWDYRCAVGRSTQIDGVYRDAGGVNMRLTNKKNDVNYFGNYHAVGSKIIGSHVLDGEFSFRSQGGLSVLRANDGKIIFACHSRTNFLQSYYFFLQCHQLFFTEDGWPVLNQNEFYPDYDGITADGTESLSALSLADIAGTYDTILTERGTELAPASQCRLFDGGNDMVNIKDAMPTESKKMTISPDGTISGDYSGTVTLAADGYSATIVLRNRGGKKAIGTFRGYFLYATDWARKSGSLASRRTVTFTTISATESDAAAGEYFWGNRQ